MKAAVFEKDHLLIVEEVPYPVLGDDDIIMKVKYCAICGSDLHRYSHGMMNPGTIMGHEFSGVVVEKGSRAKGFEIGDRVARWGGKIVPGRDTYNYPPRYSAKERGFSSARPGAYAEYMSIHCENVVKIPDEVTDLDAALLEPLTVVVHAVRQSKIKLGDNVMVVGAGPIGLFAVQCARLAGASKILVSEINSFKGRIAEELGADRAMDPESMDVISEVVRITEIGADVAFECAGAKPTLQQALELVRVGGRVMVISLCWNQADCIPVEWVGREVEMKACYGHLNSEWTVSLFLLKEKKIKTAPMISKIVGLNEIQHAFQELADNRDLAQVIVDCN